MVLGYLPTRTGSILGKVMSRAERLLYRVLFGPLPRFQGIMMFRRSLLDALPLRSTGRSWAILMELIVKAARSGFRLVSEPTEMRPRTAGKSKVLNVRTILGSLKETLMLYRLWRKEGPRP